MPSFNHQNFNISYEKIDHCGPQHTLFIHGNLASKEWWYPCIESLKQTRGDATVVAADWRGFGGSKGIASVDQIHFPTFSSDMVALLEELDLKDVCVVGHSTGGLIAMMAILQKPKLFSSLILLDSVGPHGLELTLPKEQVLSHFAKMSTDEEYCRMVLAATIRGCDPYSKSFESLLKITRSCDQPMWQGVIEVLSSQIDIDHEIKKINLPTLILHGEHDLVLPLKTSQLIHQSLTNSSFKILPDQGHSMNLENPIAFSAECLGFWAQNAVTP